LEPQDQTLIFVHIQKTAGSSLRSVIEREYPEEKRLALNWYEYETCQKAVNVIQAMAPQELKKIKMLYGHLYWGFDKYLPQPCQYITLLRDPVEFVISYYYYHCQLFPKQFSTFDNFITTHPEANNFQTRVLSTTNGISDFPEFGQCDDKMLESARQNLKERCLLSGITERFDEVLMLLKYQLGWGQPYFINRNVNRNRPKQSEITPEQLATICKNNALDLILYEEVKSRLNQILAEAPDSLTLDLRYFRLVNKNVFPMYCRVGNAFNTVRKKLTGQNKK